MQGKWIWDLIIMILVSYDIADDKLRTRFSRYLRKYGHRLQYSVYEIDNSAHFLDTLLTDIELEWGKKFGEEDSVLVVKTSRNCVIKSFGYAKHEEESLIII